MTQELKDRLMAAYGEDRFTMTVSEISARAGTRRRRLLLQLAAAAAVVLVVAAGALLQPRHHASPLTPLPTPSDSVDWQALADRCVSGWDVAKNGPMPPLVVRRSKESLGLLIYASENSIYGCHPGGSTLTLNNPVTAAQVPSYTAAATGLKWTFVIGRVPRRAVKIEFLPGRGEVYPAEIAGGVWFVWNPEGMLGNPGNGLTVRTTFPDQITLKHTPSKTTPPASEPTHAQLTSWCEDQLSNMELPGTKSSAPPKRFAVDVGSGKSMIMFGDVETMLACQTELGENPLLGLNASQRPQGVALQPMQQMIGVHFNGDGYLFGRAPEGAVKGTATLGSGTTVGLSMKDGFYFAAWKEGTPVRVEVDTASQRWVWDDGRVSSSPL